MSGHLPIRYRLALLPLVPAAALWVIVGFDLHRSPVTIGVAAGVTVVGLLLASLVTVGITRPLKDIAMIVLDLNELRAIDASGQPNDDVLPPHKLPVGGELADLAVAVADGRRRAYEFVTEQAQARRSVTDLVAHISLRNERLLGAALDALGDIGRRDHEPSTAAAIARVHRIVARVDRTTASALVLIGEGGRVASAPCSITDVVWAAALAVDSSDRIDAYALSEITIHADAVTDIAHLLAELLENALQASPAPARVTVMGAGNAFGSYELTIVDHGSGLAASELDTANRRVRRLESLHRVPVRNIGLDVVGRLARRHGVEAQLGEVSEGGVVVRVQLPASILMTPATNDLLPLHSDANAETHSREAGATIDLTKVGPELGLERQPELGPERQPELGPELELNNLLALVRSAATGAGGGDSQERSDPMPLDPTIGSGVDDETPRTPSLRFDEESRGRDTPKFGGAAITSLDRLLTEHSPRGDTLEPNRLARSEPPAPEVPGPEVLAPDVPAPEPFTAREDTDDGATHPEPPARVGRHSNGFGAADEFLPKRDRKWAAAIARARV